jgi:deoxyhypusine synthase
VQLDIDEFFRTLLRRDEFQKEMGTAELCYRFGRYIAERERKLKIRHSSLLTAAFRYRVPV